MRIDCGHPLTQLLNDNFAMNAAGLETIARYAHAIGVPKSLVMKESRGLLVPTKLVREAHAAGLAVHVWTFRAENAFLPATLRRGTIAQEHGDLVAEMKFHLSAGADGMFCDQPDIGRAVVDDSASSGV